MSYLAQHIAGLPPYWQGYIDGALAFALGLVALACVMAALGAKKNR